MTHPTRFHRGDALAFLRACGLDPETVRQFACDGDTLSVEISPGRGSTDITYVELLAYDVSLLSKMPARG